MANYKNRKKHQSHNVLQSKTEKYSEALSCKMTPEMRAGVEALAHQEDRSLQSVIRQALQVRITTGLRS